ncbi:YqaA family protein [Sulfurovum sp. ST-21]|uniref:DedA family protein n=1 Tax=Sulfurovum indicum TaxID=2779528 RepID=A0A7M1S5W4_9BACT|nr:YqaA family protein [Sulfurovum indicum]QOR62726.1 DedA family protein [Sulfurovum indicum]
MIYLSLFFIAFASATLLPLGSEAVLLYDLSLGYSVLLLWSVATLGNTLGAVVNYWLGLKGEGFLEKKGYLSSVKMEKAHQRFEKQGGWVLLLSWVPVIGDPLTFIAGVLRYGFKKFLLIVALAKGVRYLVVIGGYCWGVS